MDRRGSDVTSVQELHHFIGTVLGTGKYKNGADGTVVQKMKQQGWFIFFSTK